MRYSAIRWQVACNTLLLAVLLVAPAQRAAPQRIRAALPASPDTLDDGPHVYWQAPNRAVVFYLCGGEVVERRYQVADTLRFRGFCSDSTWEYLIAAQPPAVQPHVYDGASKIFAVSDIHGEYDALVDLLKAAGIIDDELRWAWGDGHLVIDGDTFDRGDQVTECLWLFYRLDQEARRAGGRVHHLLGNHETMAMRGDLRYVNAKYTGGIVRRARVTYPDLFGPDMELGRWLRAQHTAIKLNDVLFVHGGLPPAVAERGVDLAELNGLARATLDLRSYEVAFSDSLRNFYGHTDVGPYWYRGYHQDEEGRYSQATLPEIEVILETYGVRAVVVGHSEIDEVSSLYDGRVFGIDVPLRELGGFQGLLWQDGRFYRVGVDGTPEPL
ncbi:MAG TPA: metallophosphoesterase [Gemmatimonadota bacterium]|nr:metallophosphoesterase [Gemmatimonadota bacterium]